MKQQFLQLRLRSLSLLILLSAALTLTVSESAADQPGQDVKTDGQLELNLKTAVEFALQWNRRVAIVGYQPKIAKEELAAASSVYDVALFSTGGVIRADRPTKSLLDTGSEEVDKLVEDRWLAQAGLRKKFFTGGTVSIYQEVDYLESNSEFVTPNPQNTSRLKVQLVQPLLRNIGDPENSAKIKTARVNISVSDEAEKQQLVDIIYDVINTYWQVHLEHNLFELNKENLLQAEDILRREENRLARGIAKQLDVDRAVSAIKGRQSRLLRNENRLQTEVNKLKLLLNAPQLPLESSPLDLLPTEIPVKELADISLEDVLADGLENRTAVILAKNGLKIAAINKKMTGHNYLPSLNARMDYTLSSIGDDEQEVLEDVYSEGREGWSAWLDFEYPIGNKGSRAEYQKSQLEYQQAVEKLQHAREMVEKEIRSATLDVTLSNKQIGVTLDALEAARRVLKSEMARYELARTTNKDLLNAQDILANAEREYLRALVYYNLKLAQLNRAAGSLFEFVQ